MLSYKCTEDEFSVLSGICLYGKSHPRDLVTIKTGVVLANETRG